MMRASICKPKSGVELSIRMVARRLDKGAELTPDLREAIHDLVASAARAARRTRGDRFWENDANSVKEEPT